MVSGPNWARRYGVEPQRLCARPGCGAPATATLRFQPAQRAAWLIDVDDAAARTERDFCERHATALPLPRGWQLYDRRRAVGADTDPDAPDTPGLRRPVLRARRMELAPVPVEELEDSEEPETTAERKQPQDPEPEREVPEEPHVAGETLSNVLDARTPLLQRAFRNVWPGAGGADGTDD